MSTNGPRANTAYSMFWGIVLLAGGGLTLYCLVFMAPEMEMIHVFCVLVGGMALLIGGAVLVWKCRSDNHEADKWDEHTRQDDARGRVGARLHIYHNTLVENTGPIQYTDTDIYADHEVYIDGQQATVDYKGTVKR